MLRLSDIAILLVIALAACSSDGTQPADLPPQQEADSTPLDLEIQTQEVRGPEWTPVPPHVEKVGRFNLVWLAGTPYEMGVQHG